MSTIEIRQADITLFDTDAIVNTTNPSLQGNGGISGAIFKAAGSSLLQAACQEIGHCDTGSAVITPGFNLKARYIIHAVGPHWYGGKHNEPELLYGAYHRSLELAHLNKCTSIALPTISTGLHGYPMDQAWRVALQACRDFLEEDHQMEIIFAVHSEATLEAGIEALKTIASKYAIATRRDWETCEMPARRETFLFDRMFTPEEMKMLRKGCIPQKVEDKWFWYMEGNTLFAYLSWSGYCIYRIDFFPDGHHRVTANRDFAQCQSTSPKEDYRYLNHLLDLFTGAEHSPSKGVPAHLQDFEEGSAAGREKLLISGKKVDAIFFHAPEEPYGFLSSLYPSPFELDEIHFTSVAQYLSYHKCMLFGDSPSARSVLATEDIDAQQAIASKPKGFVGMVWVGRRQLIALRGLKAKFSQNENLRQKLLSTGEAWLVECSHKDTIWSCGLRPTEEGRCDIRKWSGQNILGFALMEVRSALQREEACEGQE